MNILSLMATQGVYRVFILVGLLLGAGSTISLAASPQETRRSTGAAQGLTVTNLYGGGKFRDPFRALAGAAAGTVSPSAPVYPEEVNIHELDLKGILKDKSGAYAIIVETKSGAGYILRGGRLYDYKNKRVPGVTGVIQARQKSVVLMTPDKDVQSLRLGEEETGGQER